MKITNVTAYPVSDGKDALFVVVDTDAGISGVGEAGATPQMLAIATYVESHFKPFLLGEDPFRIEHLWQRMFRGGFFPGGNVVSSAVSAVDIALWDIKGQALSVPVYELLGGRARDRVVCYPHNGGGTIEALVESCLRTKEQGWKFVRFSPNTAGNLFEPARAVRESIKMVEAVREALGEEIEICFDVHTRLDPADVIRFCRAVEPYHPFFIEDPIRSENAASFHHLRRHVSVPLAAGEQYASKWEFRELIENDLIDYARTDLCIVGGITEAKKVAGWAETHYIKLATHNPLGPVSSAACLALNLASNNVGVMEQPQQPGTALTNVVPVQMTWEDGYLLPPERPGLGVVFDREAAARLPCRPVPRDHLHREDGSFTNW